MTASSDATSGADLLSAIATAIDVPVEAVQLQEELTDDAGIPMIRFTVESSETSKSMEDIMEEIEAMPAVSEVVAAEPPAPPPAPPSPPPSPPPPSEPPSEPPSPSPPPPLAPGESLRPRGTFQMRISAALLDETRQRNICEAVATFLSVDIAQVVCSFNAADGTKGRARRLLEEIDFEAVVEFEDATQAQTAATAWSGLECGVTDSCDTAEQLLNAGGSAATVTVFQALEPEIVQVVLPAPSPPPSLPPAPPPAPPPPSPPPPPPRLRFDIAPKTAD